jgi:hypothetical protein
VEERLPGGSMTKIARTDRFHLAHEFLPALCAAPALPAAGALQRRKPSP